MNLQENNLLTLLALAWPDVTLYSKQKEVLHSVWNNKETVVPAGNELGKDYIAGFVALGTFLLHEEVRVITTSVKDDHLRVLWGEIGRFIDKCKFNLRAAAGGPLIVNHRDIRKVVNGVECKISYLRGMVSEKGEGMAGHHAKHTLAIIDEASGVDEIVKRQIDPWADKLLIIGNCNSCSNFFKHAVKGKPGDPDKGGDVPNPIEPGKYLRKVIRIKAEDSPNVQLGMEQARRGLKITNEEIVPGVVNYLNYLDRRARWDPERQCVGLDADWYEGQEVMLYPAEWLNRAETLAMQIQSNQRRIGKSIGIDPGEGGDDTVWTVVDDQGIIEQVTLSTPDTSIIPGHTIALGERWGVQPEQWIFDRGGGGKQHVDYLRKQGYACRSISFGESPTIPPRFGRTMVSTRREVQEDRTVFKNKRAELYWGLRLKLDPGYNPAGFAIPRSLTVLRDQLTPLPLLYDGEGKLYLPPKHRKPGSKATEQTIQELLGCSPDEADSTVLAVYGLSKWAPKRMLGAM